MGDLILYVTLYPIRNYVIFYTDSGYSITATASGRTTTGQIRDITNLFLDFPSPDPTSPDASPFEGEWVQIKNENIRLIITKDEWASKANGKYASRGFVSYTGGNAAISALAGYDAKKEKWVVYNPSMLQLLGSSKIALKGNTLILADQYEYRKVE